MTDREYVESTVAYLAEHVPWMARDFGEWLVEWCRPDKDWTQGYEYLCRHAVRRGDLWAAVVSAVGSHVLKPGLKGSIDAHERTAWRYMAELLKREIQPKTNPLVSADWWDERGEPKLAELLRKQHATCPHDTDGDGDCHRCARSGKCEHDETGWQPIEP